jgi:hypothetical protein
LRLAVTDVASPAGTAGPKPAPGALVNVTSECTAASKATITKVPAASAADRIPSLRKSPTSRAGVLVLTAGKRPVLCQNPAHALTCCFTLGHHVHSSGLSLHGPGVRLAGSAGAKRRR